MHPILNLPKKDPVIGWVLHHLMVSFIRLLALDGGVGSRDPPPPKNKFATPISQPPVEV